MPATSSLWIASLAVLVHSLAMLITTGVVALIVYEWAGLDFCGAAGSISILSGPRR